MRLDKIRGAFIARALAAAFFTASLLLTHLPLSILKHVLLSNPSPALNIFLTSAPLFFLTPALAQDDDEDFNPRNLGEATGKIASEEAEDLKAEGIHTGKSFGNVTADIPAAEKKKLESEVRTVFESMGASFVAGNVEGILALYADDYGYFGNKKADIRENVIEYLADYDDVKMELKIFKPRVLKSLDKEGVYFAEVSLIFDRVTTRTGRSREERLEKGTPKSVEKMKEDPDFEEAAEALEEFYASQKHKLDDSHKDTTPVGKEVKKAVKANFRLEKRPGGWAITEAEFGTTRRTVFLSPEEKLKKFWIFVPAGAVIAFVLVLVLWKLKDLSATSEQITVTEGEGALSANYRKELENEVLLFVESLSEGKRDEEVEKLLKAQKWDEARILIRDRISIAHELHDRNMGALYAKYEKKILEWETRYANFF